MRRETKDISTYIIVNIILLIVATLLTFSIIAIYRINKNDMFANVETISNIEESSIQVEKPEKDDNKNQIDQNVQTIVPIIINDNQEEQQQPISESNSYKYYYYQLSDNAKKIYNTIEQNMDNMKSGTYEIKLSEDIASRLKEANGKELLNTDFQSAWDAIIMDRVELFYIDVSKINLSIKTITRGSNVQYKLSMGPGSNGSYLEDGFQNEQIVDMAFGQIENIRNQIISTLSGDDYSKITKVHDWLVDNVDYGTEVSGKNSYNIYGTFVMKSVVCEGYAEGFKYIMDQLGIPCILVSGTAQNSEGTTENHEWNYVQLDGKWYAIDATWDDPIIVGGGTLTYASRYRYFMKGSLAMNINHFPNGQVSEKGMTFKYPNLENSNY